MKKIIIICVVILIVEVIIGGFYILNSSNKTPQLTSSSTPSSNITKNVNSDLPIPSNNSASLKIVSTKSTFKQGETISLTINIDTGTKLTTAADLVLQYDPEFLKPVKTSSPFSKGEAYDKLIFNVLNLKTGIATASAISNINSNFSGQNSLAKISFTALKPGTTEVLIKYSPNMTVDSNIVSEGKDILGQAENLRLEITP